MGTVPFYRKAYPRDYLYGAMYMTGGAVLVTYAMYVVAHAGLLYTIPLCCFGLLRYIYQVAKGTSGDPTEALFRDKVLLVVGLVWIVSVGWK